MCRLKTVMREPRAFARFGSNPRLRSYQSGVMEVVCHSVLNQLGLSHTVMFPRQSGKNEVQAHIELYLMTLLSRYPAELVKVSPTIEPQAQTGMRRFEKIASHHLLTRGLWKKEGKGCYRIGQARLSFLSAAPGSNIVGATASGLLEVDEAQQVSIAKFDRDIAPMSASTNATQVFWGTAWTSASLLGREMRAAQASEAKDGVRRVFRLTADDVAAEVDAYRKHVEAKVARMGRSHPMVRTQYFSEEVDGTGGMFPPERMAKMGPVGAGLAPARTIEGVQQDAHTITALLLDVAGEDEGVRSITGDLSLANPSRDATALTLVEICVGSGSKPDLGAEDMVGRIVKTNTLNQSNLGSGAQTFAKAGRPTLRENEEAGMERVGHGPTPTGLPTYRLVRRWQWIGVNHTELQAQIRDIALEWKARAVVVDATGVGAGLASFLDRALPGRVTPFIFNRTSKSKLGWDFLAIVDSNRWQEPAFTDLPGDDQVRFQHEFFEQLAACQFEVSNDSKYTMKWNVPDGSRGPVSGELLHDDWVLSAALCAVLDKMDLSLPSSPLLIQGIDPLEEMDGKY